MSVRPILTDHDDPKSLLRKKSVDIDVNDPKLPLIVQDMLDTMYFANGVGLAAIQIGVPKRIAIVAHPNWPRPEIMVNPKILAVSEELTGPETDALVGGVSEGCLSVPAQRGKVRRFAEITVEYYEPSVGAMAQTRFTGLASIIAQHELDHLDGVLFIDKLQE